jgi:hypothetical protein
MFNLVFLVFLMCFFNTFVIVVIILLFIVDVYGFLCFLFFVILPWCCLGVFLALIKLMSFPNQNVTHILNFG